jgi:hypothetical protein
LFSGQAQRESLPSENERLPKKPRLLLFVLLAVFVFGRVGGEVFPQAVIAPLKFIIEPLAALALHQALPFTAFVDDHYSEFWIDFAFTIPVAAGCADLDFGRENQFFAHIGCG